MPILYSIEFVILGMLLFSGLLSLSLILVKFEIKHNFVITLISLFLSLNTLGHIARYFSDGIDEYILAEKIVQFTVLITAVLFIEFVDQVTHYKNSKLKWSLIFGFTFLAIVAVLAKYGSDFSTVDSFQKVELPWNEQISFVSGEISSYFWITEILLIFSILYILLSTKHLAKLGHKNSAWFVRLTFLLVITSVLFDDLYIKSGTLVFPFTVQFAFIVIIFITNMNSIKSLLNSSKIERDLLVSEAKYNQLSTLSFDAVCTTQTGIITEVNSQMIKMFGYEKNELVGRNINDLFSRTTGENEIIDNGSHTIEKWAKRKDNYEFPCEIRMRASEISSEKIYINVLRDITSKKKYQNELISARDVAQKSEQLKTEFLAQMSHEIRSPINTILSFASLLAEEVAGKIDSELEKSFSSMDNAGKRIIRTIDLMLNMSEIQAGTYEPIITEIDLIEDTLRPIYHTYKKLAEELNLNFEFIIRNESESLNIVGDKYTVSQIFENLVDNAIKYTPKGRITIKVEKVNSSAIEVQVQDTGIGISEEYKPMIFKKFTQEEQGYTRRYDGNGLGLALVKNYLKINNAKLDFVSEKNVGSIFKVIFNSETVK